MSANDDEFLGIRIEREVKLKLGRIAKGERRSLSMQAVVFIAEGVKHHEDKLAASGS